MTPEEALERVAAKQFVQSLETALNDIASLVGAAVLDRIERREPSHRLSRLCADIRKCRDAVQLPPAESLALSITSITELALHMDLLRGAKSALPHWNQIAAGCVDPDFYDHLILTLATKRVFTKNWGWDVEMVPEAGTPTPDLMILKRGSPIAAVEVKSKALLKDPTSLLYDEAKRIIKGAIDGTGNATTGQLARSLPSVLVIAGFFVDPLLTKLMQKAAAEYFKRNMGRRRSLVGIMFTSVLVYSNDKDDRVGSMTPSLDVRLAFNPSYRGDFSLVEGTRGKEVDVGAFRRWDPDVIMERKV